MISENKTNTCLETSHKNVVHSYHEKVDVITTISNIPNSVYIYPNLSMLAQRHLSEWQDGSMIKVVHLLQF